MAHRNPSSVCALGSLLAAAIAAGPAGAQSGAACDRQCLRDFADAYLEALSSRDPSTLPVAEDARYTENGRVLSLGAGFWHTAGEPVRYRDYLLDPESGNVAVLTALTEYTGVAQTMLRLEVENREITEIETLVVRVGDQNWFAPEALDDFSDIFARTVPPAERHTRDELTAAAEAYFDAIETEGTPEFVQAPFGENVNRYENGLRTTNVTENPIFDRHRLHPAEQLERAFYQGTLVTDRRYPVVDTEHGSVLAIATFRGEDPDRGTLLLAEAFKVTQGRLREIRAVMLNLPRGAETGWR